MQWKIRHFKFGSAARILWRHELLSSEAGCKLHSRKGFNMFKSIFRHSSFFFLNLFRQSNDKDSFDSICTLLRYELEKEKFFETCQRTSDFCRVVFFVTPRLCGLFPNASVNETTQSVSRFHPCLYPTTYCACRSQAGVRGRHSYNYLRTEKLYCSLC